MIEVLINGKQRMIQRNIVGQMKYELKSDLNVQRISQICCIAGDQFVVDDSNISQYNSPYKFFTKDYLEQLEVQSKTMTAQYEEKCNNYDRLKDDYEEIKEKLKAQLNLSKDIDNQYVAAQKNLGMSQFVPQNVQEYEIQINTQIKEIKQLKKDLEKQKLELNEQKYQNGILKLQMQNSHDNMGGDIEKTIVKLEAKIENQKEQIEKLEAENIQLQSQGKQDLLKLQSLHERVNSEQKEAIYKMELNQKRLVAEKQDLMDQLQHLKVQISQFNKKCNFDINELSQATIRENLNLKLQIELLKQRK